MGVPKIQKNGRPELFCHQGDNAGPKFSWVRVLNRMISGSFLDYFTIYGFWQ
jgi:hypothetical protein